MLPLGMVKYDSSQLSIQNDEDLDHRWILWRGIRILGGNLLEPAVYSEWWKHVSKSLILLLGKSCGLRSIWWSKQRESISINLYNIQEQQTISITFARFRSTTSQIKGRLQWDCSAVVNRVFLVPRLWSTLLPLTNHVPKVTRHFRITITGLRTRYVMVPAQPV